MAMVRHYYLPQYTLAKSSSSATTAIDSNPGTTSTLEPSPTTTEEDELEPSSAIPETSRLPTESSTVTITATHSTTASATSIPGSMTDSSSSNGALIGGVVGGVLGLLAIFALVLFCFCRRRRKQKKRNTFVGERDSEEKAGGAGSKSRSQGNGFLPRFMNERGALNGLSTLPYPRDLPFNYRPTNNTIKAGYNKNRISSTSTATTSTSFNTTTNVNTNAATNSNSPGITLSSLQSSHDSGTRLLALSPPSSTDPNNSSNKNPNFLLPPITSTAELLATVPTRTDSTPELSDTGFYRQRAELATHSQSELINIPVERRRNGNANANTNSDLKETGGFNVPVGIGKSSGPTTNNAAAAAPAGIDGNVPTVLGMGISPPLVTKEGVILRSNFNDSGHDTTPRRDGGGNENRSHVMSFMQYDACSRGDSPRTSGQQF